MSAPTAAERVAGLPEDLARDLETATRALDRIAADVAHPAVGATTKQLWELGAVIDELSRRTQAAIRARIAENMRARSGATS